MNMANTLAMRWRRISMLSLLLALFVASPIWAQNTVTVTGTVHDTEGYEVIGATVMVVDHQGLGIATDLNGAFRLQNVPANATLRISFVGMKTQDIPLNGRTHIEVVLEPDNEVLDEVVVTALGM